MDGSVRYFVIVVIAEEADADGTDVGAAGVGSDGFFAAGATFVDVALLVDDIVVADIAPAASESVVMIDGADSGRGVIEVFGGSGVVNDDFADSFGVFDRPGEFFALGVVGDFAFDYKFAFIGFVIVVLDGDEAGRWAFAGENADIFVGAPFFSGNYAG